MSLSLFMDDAFGERYTSSHREETKEEIDDAETMFFDALETPPKPVVAHFLDADPVDVVVERLPSPMNISVDGDSVSDSDSAATASKKPRENPGFFDFGGPYLGQFEADSAPSWTVDHLCAGSRDLDTNIARIDSYNVMLKRS